MTSPVPWARRLRSERIDVTRDVEIVHSWLVHPKARYWDMLESTVDDVTAMVLDSERSGGPEHGIRLGYLDDTPKFLFELYEPTVSELADPATGYVHQPGDIGMHLLVAHTDTPISGFTFEVMRHIMRTAVAVPGVRRIVVEPDVRNDHVQRLNAAVGFRVYGDYPVGAKTARLSYCLVDDFRATENADDVDPVAGVGQR